MFEKLLSFVGDNEEAKTLINALKATQESNVETINTLERKVTDITDTRDKYKSGNTLVKSILGVDAVNEDTINEAIKALKGGKGDGASKAEIDSLKELLKNATDKSTSITSEYENKIQSMALDNALANAGLGLNVANEAMYGIVSNLVRDGAVFEEDKIVYKANGTTVYGTDGTPLTLTGKISALKTDPNYAGLFKPDVQSGTGTPSNQSGVTGIKKFSDMTSGELVELNRTNPSEYQRLKNKQ